MNRTSEEWSRLRQPGSPRSIHLVRQEPQPEFVMEKAAYVIIWKRSLRNQSNPKYGFATKNDLHDDQCTYTEVDLTAEEIGQLLGGS